MMTDSEKTNILIVDDLPEKLLVYRTVLEELGQNLVTARSGAEALRQVLQFDFAVILLDVNMPGMDGLETAALIRSRKKSTRTPIIFITAYVDDVRAAQGYAHGAVDYILAPVVPEVLRAKVKVFVELFQMTQQVKRQAEARVALAEERSKRAAAEDSIRRLAFLAQACDVLGQSLDYRVTARDLTRVCVPFLADLAAVALPPAALAPGSPHAPGPPATEGKVILALAREDGPALEECTGRDGLGQGLAAALERVLAGGPVEFLSGTHALDSVPWAVVLPLQARGQVCGALALSREASGRSFGTAERSMAETLASRAAVALDNARLYEEVQQADRQKNEFLSMLAHELRNPLAPIRNAVHVLRLQGDDRTRREWARDLIDRQIKHLVRLVDDLLDLSRVTRGKIQLKIEPVSVAAVAAEAVEASRPAIEARRHRLEVAVAPEPLWVNGDAARLAQILTNLLNNAAKYTDEGGRIWLTAERELQSVVLRVRDTGVGIPAEMLSAVFNLFTQADRSLDRSQGGLGIGLTLVRRLVEMQGGSVQAFSEGPGKGSEFVVRLPLLAEERPERIAPKAAESSLPSARCRVLVVDDHRDGGQSLAALLRLGGMEVRVVQDGPSALEAARAFRPEVVLLDIGLPGMDGYEVARRLRVQPLTRDAVLVAVTGYGRDEDRLLSRQAGFDYHLVKPVDLATLQAVLASRPAEALPAPASAEPARNGVRSGDIH